MSLALALGLVELFLPLFNEIAARDLAVTYTDNAGYMAALLGLVLVTGLVAGSYPAFYLSGFMPARVLKGAASAKGSNVWIRKGLVVFQFSISVVLMACTLIAVQQLDFLQEKRLGFDQDRIIRLRLTGGVDYDLLQNELAALPSVVGVTSSSTPPGLGPGNLLPYKAGLDLSEASTEDPVIAHNQVDYDFVDQMGLHLIAGRNFSEDLTSDIGIRPEGEQYFHLYDRAFLINEATARANGWSPEEALGQQLRIYAFENNTYFTDLRGTVVGVLEDFHFRSLRTEIEPAAFSLAMMPQGHIGGFALVKVGGGNASALMAAVEGVWKRIAPAQPFEASFLDQDIQNMYVREAQLSQVIGVFAVLGIFIACLGLVGLATFAAEQRTKEIGVRKVMGATVAGLVGLLSKDFLRLVLVAFILGAPIAYFVMADWLNGFAYHVAISPFVFVGTGVAALLIALVSVGYQAYQAARANPVESLRYE